MPNWITTKIKAPQQVIAAMLNADGIIDFNVMMPSPTPYGNDWSAISMAAETAAEAALRKPVDSHPLIGSLQRHNRSEIDVSELSDNDFEQFVAMLRNHRACGYLHLMDFAREAWGTKWNACEPQAAPEEGRARFETAWARPFPVLQALSARFPEAEIHVEFADEDIGSNCGSFTLLAGEKTLSDIAPAWRDMDEAQRKKWRAFACEIKGWTPSEEED